MIIGSSGKYEFVDDITNSLIFRIARTVRGALINITKCEITPEAYSYLRN
jgi:hypothetical protein